MIHHEKIDHDKIDKMEKLVATIEWLAWADGLVDKDEALLITLHQSLVTGLHFWDVSALPPEKRAPVLKMIEQIKNGTHPSQLNPDYHPAREGEPDPGFPWIKTALNFGRTPRKEDT
jgi:hypothetical protein